MDAMCLTIDILSNLSKTHLLRSLYVFFLGIWIQRLPLGGKCYQCLFTALIVIHNQWIDFLAINGIARLGSLKSALVPSDFFFVQKFFQIDLLKNELFNY